MSTNRLDEQLWMAAQEADEMGQALRKLALSTFSIAVKIADELLNRNYALSSFSKGTSESTSRIELGADTTRATSMVERIKQDDGPDYLTLGFIPNKQGTIFEIIYLNIQIQATSILVHFGQGKRSLSLEMDAWSDDATDSQKRNELLSLMKAEFVRRKEEMCSSEEMTQRALYVFPPIYIQGPEQSAGVDSGKPKKPIGFLRGTGR